MTLAEFPPAIFLTFGVLLGLLFGSFANVVIYRLPRGENLAFPASHCTACGKPIKAYDNLPVVGYVFLRGRARCCKAPISWRYPVVEAFGGMWSYAVLQFMILDLPRSTPLWQAGLAFLVWLAFGLLLLCALFIDLDHMLLPDELTLGGAALGLVTSGWLRSISFVDSLIGAAVGFFTVWLLFVEGYRRLRGYPGMGLGDAKLLMLAGAFFGWVGVLFALLLGAALGTVTAIAVLVARGKLEEPEAVQKERQEVEELLTTLEGEEREELEQELRQDPLYAAPGSGFAQARIPFGPFLVTAILAYPFVGGLLIDLYLGL